MSALMRGAVQSSVERYHDVCGPGSTINTHQLFRVQMSLHIKCSKMALSIIPTFNIAVGL